MAYGVPWTADEEALLRKLVAEGLTIRQLGVRLGRTHNSVQRHLMAMRLRTQGKARGGRTEGGKFAKTGPTKREQAHRAGPVTLPPLASLQDVD